MHVIHWSKPTEIMTPRVNPDINYEFRVLVMCQCRLIHCKKFYPLWAVDDVGGCGYVEIEGTWRICTFLLFRCQPATALKNLKNDSQPCRVAFQVNFCSLFFLHFISWPIWEIDGLLTPFLKWAVVQWEDLDTLDPWTLWVYSSHAVPNVQAVCIELQSWGEPGLNLNNLNSCSIFKIGNSSCKIHTWGLMMSHRMESELECKQH